MSATDFIKAQAEADTESWMQPHQAVMANYKLRDVVAAKIKSGLRCYAMIRAHDEAWSEKVQSGELPFDAEVARAARAAYETWLRPCGRVFAEVAKLQADDFLVDGTDELREARHFVRLLLSTPVEQIIESMEQIARGESRDFPLVQSTCEHLD